MSLKGFFLGGGVKNKDSAATECETPKYDSLPIPFYLLFPPLFPPSPGLEEWEQL